MYIKLTEDEKRRNKAFARNLRLNEKLDETEADEKKNMCYYVGKR